MNKPLEMPRGIKKRPITVSPMRMDEADRVGAVFVEVVSELPYYNVAAKSGEIAKYTADKLQAALALDDASMLVARFGTEIVGFCSSHFDDGPLWLSWFGVRVRYRGLGVGDVMMEALDQRARNVRSHKIWCDSRTTNEPSGTVLQRHGFQRVCTLRDHWYRQDFILWEKVIASD